MDAPATERRLPFSSAGSLHWMPRLRCQNWQSAAPPAMVPSRYGLISITFLTVCDEMYGPWEARESTAMTTPCSKMKPSVVVP